MKKNELCPHCGSSNLMWGWIPEENSRTRYYKCISCEINFQYQHNDPETDVILQADEVVVKSTKVREASNKRYGRGILTLTDRRIIFEKTSGIFNKKKDVVWSMNLHRIASVGLGGLFRKSITIEFSWIDKNEISVRSHKKETSLSDEKDIDVEGTFSYNKGKRRRSRFTFSTAESELWKVTIPYIIKQYNIRRSPDYPRT